MELPNAIARASLLRQARAHVSGIAREDAWLARVLVGWAALQLGLALWDLPSAYGWENDGIAPRDVFGGLAINLIPGRGHRYPLFHYVLVALASLPAFACAVFDAALAGELSIAGLEQRVLSVQVMTCVSLAAKLLSVAMGYVAVLTLARIVRRTAAASERAVKAGRYAALFAATSTTIAYYARTSNLDGPALMWTLLALDRGLDLLRGGTRRDYAVMGALIAAAVATKDQAYGAFALVLPFYGALLLRTPGSARMLGLTTLTAAGTYAVISGALFNPTGFVTRVKLLTGPNSSDWRQYEHGAAGVLANLRDLAIHQAEFFWPWPVVALGWLGIGLALRERTARAERMLLLAAAGSSLVTFTLVVARCEHRFVLMFAAALAAYAGLAAAELHAILRAHRLAMLAPLLLGALAVVAVGRYVALGATQLGDARREVESLLSRLPRGSHVEVYGLIVYWPRFDFGASAPYRVTHVDPRQLPMPGLAHDKPPYADPAERGADVLVVPEEFAQRFAPSAEALGHVRGKHVNDGLATSDASRFFSAALDGHVAGYRLALVAAPRFPSALRALGLGPIEVQGSTGKRTRVFVR